MDWDSAYRDMVACATIKESDWIYDTSAGVEGAVSIPGTRIGVAGTTGALWFHHKRTNAKVRLNYGGVGMTFGEGLSNFVGIPVSGSFAIPDMPSVGVVYKLPFACRTLSLRELKGGFLMLQGSADAGPGKAYGAMFLGGNLKAAGATGYGPASVSVLAATSNACLAYGAMFASIMPFNIALTAYIGQII